MAARYWVGGHVTNNNWNQTGSGDTNWSATSGGASGASVPVSGDSVIFDSAGNSNSTVSATITISSMTVTSGFTATITINATITNNSSLTLTTGFNIAGSFGMNLSSTATITSGGFVWPNIMTFSSSNTKTLVGDFQITNTLTIGNAMAINRTTTEIITVRGLTMSANCSGTAAMYIDGGTWNGSGNVNMTNLYINGTMTIGTVANFGTGTMTYLSGTITCTGTLTLVSSCTLNTAGIQWNTLAVQGATYTLTSLLTANTITSALSSTFAGTHGWTCGTFSHTGTSAFTITLKETLTYTITSSLSAYLSRTDSIILFTSSTMANTFLTLSPGATCQCLADFTRIDASGGRPIRTFNGVLTSCTNIVSITDLKTVTG